MKARKLKNREARFFRVNSRKIAAYNAGYHARCTTDVIFEAYFRAVERAHADTPASLGLREVSD